MFSSYSKAEADTETALSSLSPETFFPLFSGLDAWNLNAFEPLGYPSIMVTDCGHGVTLVAPPYGCATCFPTSVGMAATWNPALLEEVGRALGRETRAKDCAILLGPMINLHRLPGGGRNYETFSEDPVLTGKMAAAIVRGIQSEGTGACVKQFACNNQQYGQTTTSSQVDERTLRELYLKSFAIVIDEASPWMLMTSYNPINGEYPGDSRFWIEDIIRGEMDFTGTVVSDWHAVRSDAALTSGLDIEMPGPGKVLNPEKLGKALEQGIISPEDVRARAARVLQLYERCSQVRTNPQAYSAPELDSARHRQLTRTVAEESIVLLKNERETLPLQRDKIRRLAVIGPNAATARLGGGGSASVSPFYSVSPLQGIQNLVGDTVEVVYTEGCSMDDSLPVIGAEHFAPLPDQFGEGLLNEFFNPGADGYDWDQPACRHNSAQINYSWGWAAPEKGVARALYAARWTGFIRFPASGEYELSLAVQEGCGRIWLDDELVLDAWPSEADANFEEGYTNRGARWKGHQDAGKVCRIRIEYQKKGARGGIRFGWKTPNATDPISLAEELARSADAVVLLAGIYNLLEGGNCDRAQFRLPDPQEALIRRVTQANPNTAVVLVNATPVSLHGWIDSVPAVLEAFYSGQEGGNALARILFGEVNPSGKLPDTIPNNWEEVPALRTYPGDLKEVRYAEGLMVGYRHYDASGTAPAYPFGFGLSYTRFAYGEPVLEQDTIHPSETAILRINVTNTGERTGKETVQLYLEVVNPPAGRPPRSLINFKKITLEPGQTQEVQLQVRYNDLLTYNPEQGRWMLEFTRFNLAAGPHSGELKRVRLLASATVPLGSVDKI